MKALLKRVLGGLKCAASVIPFALALGGTATFIWLSCHGANTLNGARDEVRSLPEYQETIETDQAILKDQLDNKLITTQDYIDKKEDLGSNDYLMSYLKLDEEKNQDYIDRINSGFAMETSGIFFSIVYPLAAAVGTFAYVGLDGFSTVLDSAWEDFYEATQISSEKKKKREYDEYTEELE